MRFSKWVVSSIVALNTAFTIAVLFIFYRVGAEPTTLIGAWFAFTTGELLALAAIKRKEITSERNSQEEEGRYGGTI